MCRSCRGASSWVWSSGWLSAPPTRFSWRRFASLAVGSPALWCPTEGAACLGNGPPPGRTARCLATSGCRSVAAAAAAGPKELFARDQVAGLGKCVVISPLQDRIRELSHVFIVCNIVNICQGIMFTWATTLYTFYVQGRKTDGQADRHTVRYPDIHDDRQGREVVRLNDIHADRHVNINTRPTMNTDRHTYTRADIHAVSQIGR